MILMVIFVGDFDGDLQIWDDFGTIFGMTFDDDFWDDFRMILRMILGGGWCSDFHCELIYETWGFGAGIDPIPVVLSPRFLG